MVLRAISVSYLLEGLQLAFAEIDEASRTIFTSVLVWRSLVLGKGTHRED